MIKDIKTQNENVQATDRVMAKLHADFPQCLTNEGKFDLEKFKSLLNDKIDITEEGYDLNFLGKNYANLIASTETETVIQPDIEHNSKPENKDSQNIYISGDNLDALKHLLKSYAGNIKCIYIDPPYNTGSDGFVYNDKFNFTVEQLQTKLGIGEEKAKRILDLCTRGSASHSAWLMFMAPRLMLARDLLTEDGVIFISIDDNEQANLTLLSDAIWGEENRDMMIWRKSGVGRDGKMKNTTTFRKDHEYIVVCFREKQELNKSFEKPNWENKYDNPDNDPRGSFKAGSISRKEEASNPNHDNYYTVTSPSGKKFTRQFDVSEDEFKQLDEDNRIYWGKNLDAVPAKKIFENEKREVTTSSLIIEKDCFIQATTINDIQATTTIGSKELEEILEVLGLGEEIRPKPSYLIQKLIQIGANKTSIILDFFSGSATTAHAVMKLNSEDGGKRKYIMVQLPEQTPADSEARKAGYETIDQIGQERIRRAAAKIKSDLQTEISQKETQLKAKEEKLAKENRQRNMFNEENPLEQEIETLKQEIETKKNTLQNMDWGFKHYTLQDVPQNTLDRMEKYDPSMSNAFADTDILESFGKETVLATWMEKDGYGLTQNAELLQLADYTAYHCGGHIYMIEGEGFDEKAMIALVDKYGQEADFNPHNVVLFGYSFTFTQTEMIKKNLSAVKKLNESINIDIRY